MNTNDTITAPATGIGGAVTIIRISGKEALSCAAKVWQGRTPLEQAEPRKMYLGKVGGDPTLAVYMKAPASYTGDDVVELQCHGGAVAANAVLRALLSAGCRMAEPGEFTFRAFVNGKLDLAQAEAVADLINSGSESAMHLAERQLAGSLSTQLDAVYDGINHLRSECEARLDFPDEELDFDTDLIQQCIRLKEMIAKLLASREAGARLRDGIDIVLAGRPNAGKSSLLNRLAGFDRAIVSDIPGTTRDTVEHECVLCGIPVRLTDTAGLRNSDDPIETLGIERSRRSIAAAQMTFWLLDASSENINEETQELKAGCPGNTIAIWNKCDLISEDTPLPELDVPSCRISALNSNGIEELTSIFKDIITNNGESSIMPETAVNARMADALQRGSQALDRASEKLADEDFELAACDLHDAASAIGETTGKTASCDLLDEVFHRFCLGK
ncbi:MAG: tRNA uridine-5-carboxymethylaminomethyl(34) synthesis GTPase MnmE [Lentisphaeria bacterium]|nr:tRNA uridine-5-carboxymethylaminomethyl(34) synthesis GTPase MnmE [Lentisphaeria bacterium]